MASPAQTATNAKTSPSKIGKPITCLKFSVITERGDYFEVLALSPETALDLARHITWKGDNDLGIAPNSKVGRVEPLGRWPHVGPSTVQ